MAEYVKSSPFSYRNTPPSCETHLLGLGTPALFLFLFIFHQLWTVFPSQTSLYRFVSQKSAVDNPSSRKTERFSGLRVLKNYAEVA